MTGLTDEHWDLVQEKVRYIAESEGVPVTESEAIRIIRENWNTLSDEAALQTEQGTRRVTELEAHEAVLDAELTAVREELGRVRPAQAQAIRRG